MRKSIVPKRVLAAAALVAASLPWPILAAPAPPAQDEDTALSPVEKARKGLDRLVTLKIDRQTLGQAVAQLGEKAKLHIVLDAPAITGQLGSPPDGTPVSAPADLKGVKARTALRTLLAPYNLAFVIVGDSVVVTTADGAAERQMGQHVSISLDKVDLAAALKQLSRDAGVNLVLDPRAEKEASAKVSLQLDDVSLEKAVRLLAEMAGLKPVRAGNTLFVTKKEIAAEMRADPDLAPMPKNFIIDGDRDFIVNVNNVVVVRWQAQNGRIIAAPPVAPPPILQPNPPDAKDANPPAGQGADK